MGEAAENKNQPESELSLDRRYVYQNPTTGTVSSTSLTVKQLCRMFSPPVSVAPSGDVQPPSVSRFTADTQLLALLDDGTTYDPSGWQPAKEIPVLRHAVCPSFYYTIHDPEKTTKGPISCRQLSEVKMLDAEKDQVYGESTGNQWALIKSLPDLELTLESFRDQAGLPINGVSKMNGASQSAPQEYDVSLMVYDDDNDKVDQEMQGTDSTGIANNKLPDEVQDELEAFLTSTDGMGPKAGFGGDQSCAKDEEEDEGYESDGGTKYAKDPRTGNWVHHSLVPKREKPAKNDKAAQAPPTKKAKTQHPNITGDAAKKKANKTKFKAKNAKCWIYVTGLPPDASEDEVAKFFSKVGIIDLNPETQRPKVNLYRYKVDTPDEATGAVIPAGTCKGDASIGYARPESVALALQVLDEAPFRDSALLSNSKDKPNPYKVSVQKAKFEQHGEYAKQRDKKKRISQAQRKVARMAAKQAVDWDEGDFNGRLTGGLKGLHIIVLKRMFQPHELAGGDEKEDDSVLAKLEKEVRTSCEKHGNVEKITVFSKNPQGVVVVKFTQPPAASEAVKAWDGRSFSLVNQERKVEATFWDGVEDYTVRDNKKDEAEMEKRHEAFGAWLEGQAEEELPEELRLQVEK